MSEFVKFIPGINPTRAKKQYGIDVIEYYDQNAFEYDYGQRYNFIERVSVEMNIPDELALKEGDVVISNSMHDSWERKYRSSIATEFYES